MRQFGGLPFSPIRRLDFEKQTQTETVSRGLDQEVRRLCREATRAINRYPLKDPFSFATSEDDDQDDDDIEVEEDSNIDTMFDSETGEAVGK